MFWNDATEIIILDIPVNKKFVLERIKGTYQKDLQKKLQINSYRSISGSSDRYVTDPVRLLFCKYLHRYSHLTHDHVI